jgi:hypothetical protein
MAKVGGNVGNEMSKCTYREIEFTEIKDSHARQSKEKKSTLVVLATLTVLSKVKVDASITSPIPLYPPSTLVNQCLHHTPRPQNTALAIPSTLPKHWEKYKK